ncbi:MAG: heme-degrading domain-containing protein [Microbacteriaceae bacterium]|nr:heme-degrading domain-containing protein [Microbacteriaceae bacterium]
MEAIAQLIAAIEEQERTLRFRTFSNADALALGSLLVELALERELAVTIDITRGQQQLFHVALAGTAAHNDVWVARKTRTVRELGHSSFLAGLRAKLGGTIFDQSPWIDALQFSGHGGSFPVNVVNVGLVGTVTVSGLPQAEDHALVVEAIEIFLTKNAAE